MQVDDTKPVSAQRAGIFYWIKTLGRCLWYLILIFLIFILFQGPEKGFRYLGL